MSKLFKINISIISIIMIFILYICLFKNDEVNATEIEKVNSSDTVYVDIKGAVNNPGVYEMKKGSRVIDVIIKAGDLTENADTSILNLSKTVTDEMYIIVYTKEEIFAYKDKIIPSKKIIKEIEEKIICPDTDNDACITNNDKVSNVVNGLVNINTASLEELQTVQGIGETKAKKIIEYRENNKFESIEDIKNVSGIGESTYEKIKDYITY